MIKKLLEHKLQTIFFLLIVILATVLRLYQIQSVPPGVNRDEASIGYTAYSLLHTGKDEYGRVLPLAFESFGDWKLPLYIYENVISVGIFGLNEFAVRFPSALAGIGAVIVSFFLFRELIGNKYISFLGMLLFAIAPWSIHMSRVGAETNTAVFLSTLATLLFLKSLKNYNWLLFPSLILFSLTYFTYAGNYIFTSLLLVGLALFYGKLVQRTKLTLSAIILFIILLSIATFANLGANHTKISGIGIFGDPSVVHAQLELPRLQHTSPNSFTAKYFHNRVIYGIEQFMKNYVNGFSPEFLFEVGGTNHAHNIANFGNAYLVEAPFFLLGLIYLIAFKKGKEKKIILWWILISPIAAAITKDAPHSTRQFAIFPMFPLITTFGIWYVYSDILKNKVYQKFFICIVSILFVINIGIYLDRYYVHFPLNEEQNWGFIYKDLVIQLQKPEFKNKQIVITKPTYSPYIFLLFYSHYDPALYQKQAIRYPETSDGFFHVQQFGRFSFRDIDWQKDMQLPNTILVNDYVTTPQTIRENQTDGTYLPVGQPMFSIIIKK